MQLIIPMSPARSHVGVQYSLSFQTACYIQDKGTAIYYEYSLIFTQMSVSVLLPHNAQSSQNNFEG